MARHDVFFNVPERQLGKADIEFRVMRDGKKFGRLLISNGTAVWVPKNKKYGYILSWNQLAEFFEGEGTPQQALRRVG